MEERHRPSQFLGYDHDSLGAHLLAIGALEAAESELRRAAWLNPYESRFRLHLGWCLLRVGKLREAGELASKLLHSRPSDPESRRLLSIIREKARAAREAPHDASGAEL
jgi:Flp pilus assembly protein TadD